jgi:hypothetical protein
MIASKILVERKWNFAQERVRPTPQLVNSLDKHNGLGDRPRFVLIQEAVQCGRPTQAEIVSMLPRVATVTDFLDFGSWPLESSFRLGKSAQ